METLIVTDAQLADIQAALRVLITLRLSGPGPDFDLHLPDAERLIAHARAQLAAQVARPITQEVP